ncbi:unnamed protein product [Clonostachys rosea f. rosea IK726]|uniref:Uncharacterized protein n=1 Tax=Clonostachys rosea f. rosea IK726 TaxID=1349383 RepID=A0ACA9USG5_BIOOC|nr:unnamed protein product [Clonostachys rosea f. rosea IK726]
MYTGDFSFLHPSRLYFEQSNSLISPGTTFSKSQYDPYLLVSFTIINSPPKHCLDGNQARPRVLNAFSIRDTTLSVENHGKVIRRHGFVDDDLSPYDRRPRPAIALLLSQVKSRNSPVRHMPARY